jgi:hypothetical protein
MTLSPARLRQAIASVERQQAALDRRGRRLVEQLFKAEARVRKAKKLRDDGWTYTEIGAAIGCTKQMAYSLLNPRVRRRCTGRKVER